MNKFLKFLPLIFIALYVLVVYKPFIFQGKLPIPADTIVGLYHPWRDFFIKDYPSGIPFKNILVTDSVRQQYPWRELAINELKQGRLPVWNPYSFAGYPLMANIQSAAFYPLNLVFWLAEFPIAWAVQVLLQPFLGFAFMYFFLRNHKLRQEAAILGSIAWASSGFFVAWTTSNTIVHAAIWLPLALLSVDEIIGNRPKLKWGLTFIISLLSTFLAGHLQTFIYVLATIIVYILSQCFSIKKNKPLLLLFGLLAIFISLSLFITIPTIEFIIRSARDVDQLVWQKPDWFLPWQNLIQFIAPDFFGNPATLNYFGIWNYGEFVGYIGMIPLLFSFVGVLFAKSRKKLFFTLLLIGALLFTLPTPLAKLPYKFKIPFLVSTQPSRLIVIVDFALAVLAAFGLDFFLTNSKKNKGTLVLAGFLAIFVLALWIVAKKLSLEVSLHNLYLPTLILSATVIFLLAALNHRLKYFAVAALLAVSLFDMCRFAVKFIPFSPGNWLYPQTITTKFLQDNTRKDFSRILSIDNRIMSQNFSTAYQLQAISGYDPLYLLSYGQFMIAMNRKKPDVSTPFGFNRAIDPQDPKSPFINLLGIKYIMSVYSIFDPQFKLVLTEGITKTYQNLNVFPRTFFLSKTTAQPDEKQVLRALYEPNFNPRFQAIVETEDKALTGQWSVGQAKIVNYQPNRVQIQTSNSGPGFLILTDVNYPAWKAKIDGRPAKVYSVDYIFRGVVVPKGNHDISFDYEYFPF